MFERKRDGADAELDMGVNSRKIWELKEVAEQEREKGEGRRKAETG